MAKKTAKTEPQAPAADPSIQPADPPQVPDKDTQTAQAANADFLEGFQKVLKGEDPYADPDDQQQQQQTQPPPAQPQKQPAQRQTAKETQQESKPAQELSKSKTLSAVEKLKQASGQTEETAQKQTEQKTEQQGEKDLPDPDQPIPEYKEGQTKADQWKEVHQTKNEAIRRAVKAEEEAAKAKETVHQTYRQQLEEQRKQIEQLDSELQRVAAERSPKLQAEFQNRQSLIDQKVKNIIPTDKQETVRQLLQAPPSETRTQQLEEIFNELSPLRQQEFRDVWSRQNQLRDEREQKIQESIQNRQQESQSAEAERQQKLQQARDIFNQVQSQYQQKYSTPDNPDWNSQLEEALAGARNDFEADLPMDQLSDMTIRARMAPVYANLAIQLSEELAEVQEQLKKFQTSEPELGGHQESQEQSDQQDPSKMLEQYGSAGHAIAAAFQRQGGQLG